MFFTIGFILALFGAILLVAVGLLGLPDYVKVSVYRKASAMFFVGLLVCGLSLAAAFVEWAWKVLP